MGTTNGNEDLCWALFLAQARGADRTEHELLTAMRDTIHIAQDDWLTAINELPADKVKSEVAARHFSSTCNDI